MPLRKLALTALVLVLPLSGCGGGGSSSGAGAAATTSLTGTWVGRWEADPGFVGEGLARLRVKQSGGEISGTGRLSGSRCFSDVALNGLVSGNSVSVNMAGELGRLSMDLRRVGENRLSGTARVVSSFICGGTATVDLARE